MKQLELKLSTYSKITIITMALLIICILPAYAEEASTTTGYAIDMLPTLLNSETGNFGGACQIWWGKDHHRTKLSLASLQFPDSILNEPAFTDKKLDSIVISHDYFFSDGLKGWWIGGGLEYWSSSITHKQTNTERSFSSAVLNLGAGYKFNIGKNLYIEPWGGLHYALDKNSIAVGSDSYNPDRVTYEISIKFGWNTGL